MYVKDWMTKEPVCLTREDSINLAFPPCTYCRRQKACRSDYGVNFIRLHSKQGYNSISF